jgi:hypothetical protein
VQLTHLFVTRAYPRQGSVIARNGLRGRYTSCIIGSAGFIHDRHADGSNVEAHWACDIHQQIFSLCALRPPFLPGARPRSRIIREQLVERDPELATLLETAVELEIAAGSMVYARRDEPTGMVVVPSKGAFKWSLLLSESAAEQAACSSGDVREIFRLAVARAGKIVIGYKAMLHWLPRIDRLYASGTLRSRGSCS